MSESPVAYRIALAKNHGVTERYLEILEYLADGMTLQEVATELHLAYPTVQCHVMNLRDKLSAKNIAHAVAIGFRNQFLK